MLALAGYAALIAWHREPVAGVASAQPLRERQLPPPEHLAAGADRPVGDAVPTDASSTWAADEVEVAIVVNGAPNAPPTAGVLVTTADTQAPLAWLPFGDAPGTSSRRWTMQVPRRPLRVFVAEQHASAASAWWASTSLSAPSTGQQIDIDAAPHPVTLHLDLPGAAPLRSRPFALRRIGEPAWRLPRSGPAGLTIDPAKPWTLALGAGDYELEPLLDGPWQPAAISVRGPLEQRLTFARRPRADRP
ncbi:MAG: hypothetical protein IPK26_01240 [Planctomycetes bacterium]|nr:hypothetical protein [Planctomycetota bacterium]